MEANIAELANSISELSANVGEGNGVRLYDFAPIIFAISVIIAYWGILQNRRIARKRATLDLIEKVESSNYYRELLEVFHRRKMDSTLEKLSEPKDAVGHKERKSVFSFLNHYELVSLGIQKEILDEEFYKGWMRSSFIDDWIAAKTFIQRERWKKSDDGKSWVYHAKLYEHYNCVAHRWSPGEVEILSEKSGGHPDEPVGPGDQPMAGVGDEDRDNC